MENNNDWGQLQKGKVVLPLMGSSSSTNSHKLFIELYNLVENPTSGIKQLLEADKFKVYIINDYKLDDNPATSSNSEYCSDLFKNLITDSFLNNKVITSGYLQDLENKKCLELLSDDNAITLASRQSRSFLPAGIDSRGRPFFVTNEPYLTSSSMVMSYDEKYADYQAIIKKNNDFALSSSSWKSINNAAGNGFFSISSLKLYVHIRYDIQSPFYNKNFNESYNDFFSLRTSKNYPRMIYTQELNLL
jgi:hypothetical protein